ncbi:MAG: MFS transporter [Nocardioides sp.]|uniref:MFS transporter n=1 Tax=Nocardioides sp. TaxID=35761 RepID=UPI0039E5E98D
MTSTERTTTSRIAIDLWRIVGFLVCVEAASGILQGYYTPIYSDLADHLGTHDADINWLEAAQLIVSALAVPPLARLGDAIGHRRVLLLATAITALASWWLVAAPSFPAFLAGWALQGAYVVWLPLEIAIIHRRTAGDTALTRRAAGVLVGALELAVILGAGLSGVLVGSMPMALVLAFPALAVSATYLVIRRGVPDERPNRIVAGFDYPGLAALSLALGLVMGGLVCVRVLGVGSVLAWLLVALGVLALVPFWRIEASRDEPLVDVRLLAEPGQWPVQAAAFFFGMSVLGAQIPLSTFARTDPSAGYGLGAGAGFVSLLIAVYVVAMAAGAFGLPILARRLGATGAQVFGCALVAIGYALWLPLHAHTGQAVLNMVIIGVGSGTLVASIPAAAAAAAPTERTAFATGMTNAVKTIGGAIASAVFAIALSATGSIADPTRGHAPLSGYLTVWAVCAASAALAGLLLLAGRRRTTIPARSR